MKTARLPEWGQRRLPDWSLEARAAVAQVARAWQQDHRLPRAPLEWGGLHGDVLTCRQWVGIVEVEGHRIEIYPKLDAGLLNGPLESTGDVAEVPANSTLAALLPLLEVAHFGGWVESGQAQLGVGQLSFADLWAYLLGKHLLLQLRRGLCHAYREEHGDLPTVRGKIVVARQMTAHFDRMDRIACVWDEFTPDTPLNRLLKCACAVLLRRSGHPAARGLLADCLFLLDAVTDVPPTAALRATDHLTFTRATQRFASCFELARRILQDMGPELGSREARSWTFLVDMNAVFEAFCRAAIAQRFGVLVEEQKPVGTLFQLQTGGLRQLADFVWTHQGHRWIADAKWKLVGQNAPDFDETGIRANALAPADVRQLTVYAELLMRREGLHVPPHLAILYPLLGQAGNVKALPAWNGSAFQLWPVRVTGWSTPGEALEPML